jgi:hypothetical protein
LTKKTNEYIIPFAVKVKIKNKKEIMKTEHIARETNYIDRDINHS